MRRPVPRAPGSGGSSLTSGKLLAIASVFIIGILLGGAFQYSGKRGAGNSSGGGSLVSNSLFRQQQVVNDVPGVKAGTAADQLQNKHAALKNVGKSQRDVANKGHNAFEDHAHARATESPQDGVEGKQPDGGDHQQEEKPDSAATTASPPMMIDVKAPHRGIQCPPEDAEIDKLQIPLKHLPRKKPTSVRQKYDRRAHNCASNGIWNRVTKEDHYKILKNIVRLAKIKKGAFVFDWGSGCGHSMQWLYESEKATGVGVDVSSKTIQYSIENTTKQNLYCVADGTKLGWLPTGSFDNAFSFGSIYHVYNRTLFCHVLRQMVRLVKVGGTVYNGWTENAEYKRIHVPMCLEGLPVKHTIYEENVEMADVKIYPLKARQETINSYSLVIERTGEIDEEEALKMNSLDSVPIWCDTHRCMKRSEFVPSPAPPTKKGKATVAPIQEEVVVTTTSAPPPSPPPQESAEEETTTTAVPSVEVSDRKKKKDVEGEKNQEEPDVVEGGAVDVACPPYDEGIEKLQIPLEHLPRKKKTSVAQKYDRRAHNCARDGIWHDVPLADHRKILRRIAKHLKLQKQPGLKVFDWGSGCGHKLMFLNKEYKSFGFGIDVSNLTVAYANENTTRNNRFCVADGTRMEWIPSDYFDRSFSFGSIYHVYNTEKFCHVLQEMVRITKPGGIMFNGWTENKEFKRKDVEQCINGGIDDESMKHTIEILEDKVEFAHVAKFPLKQYQKVPNTYSLLVTKSSSSPQAGKKKKKSSKKTSDAADEESLQE